MADEMQRFSNEFWQFVEEPVDSGEKMIAISRAILRNDFSDSEITNGFFDAFSRIADDSSDIVLVGFGENDIGDLRKNKHTINKNRNLNKEINELFSFYYDLFAQSRANFVEYFK